MAFGGKVDDAVDIVLLHQRQDGVEIADVGLDERIVGFVLDVLQVGKVAGVGQLVEVDDMIIGILVDEKTYNV